MNSRYGRENIGILWVIGEPMMLATVIILVHTTQRTHFSSDIEPAPFAIIGYCIFIIFRGIFNRSEAALEHSQSLFYHRQITVFDLVIARALPDLVGCVSAGAILMTIAIMVGAASLPARPLHLFAAVAMMGWWSIALAMLATALTYGSETLGRQLHVISYFSIPISGAFFTLDMLPPSFQRWLAWNPMVLIFEQARFGQFVAASHRFVDPSYVCAVCAVLTVAGLIAMRHIRDRIHG